MSRANQVEGWPGSDRIERNRSRFIAEAVRHELQQRRRVMALWGGGCGVLQRQALYFPGPDAGANVGQPREPFLLQLLRGQGGAAAGVAEHHRGPGQRNKTVS